MRKYFKLSFLINLFTILLFFFYTLESIFYLGFTQKHFLINPSYFLAFYLIFSLIFSFLNKSLIHPKLIKLNQILFPFLLIVSITFFNLEKYTYPNFIYGRLHINPINFIYLPFISALIFYFNRHELFKKTIIFIIIPLITTYVSQFLSFSQKINLNLPLKTIIINYILWLFILLFFTSLFRKRYLSLTAFLCFFSILNLINHYKIKFLDNFFVISDIYLAKNLQEFILPLVKGANLKIEIILIIIIFSLLFLFFKKFFNFNNPPFKTRLILFIVSGFILIFPVFFSLQFKQILQRYKIETFIPNPIQNCNVNGILFCFYDDFKNIKNPPPKNYSQSTINQIYSDVKNNLLLSKEVSEFNEEGIFKPNIIVIMSESFWDVAKLPNVKYSEDPIKNVRKDIKSTFVSPSFGGGTANVEFELLTGLSNYFLNGKTPYGQTIKKSLPSLFTLFKDEGYLTTTIHPFLAPMYNRQTIYKNFGLDKFITIKDMPNFETAGPYVSDEYFNKEILKQLNSTDQSQFIFALSMQNHVTFEANRYSQHSITFQSSLNSDNQAILQSYVDGINLTDQSYLNLKTELSKIKKPTVVFFFGDHMAFLDSNYNIYKETGFNLNDEVKKRHTPLAVWSNYKNDINLPDYISPSFLSLEVLKSANIIPKHQFAFLKSINNSDSVLSQKTPIKITSDQLKNYELIQYDLIFGKQYGIESF